MVEGLTLKLRLTVKIAWSQIDPFGTCVGEDVRISYVSYLKIHDADWVILAKNRKQLRVESTEMNIRIP